MTDTSLWFGYNGSSSTWYLGSGGTGFQAIDTTLLPGPRPGQPPSVKKPEVVWQEVGSSWSDALLYKGNVQANTEGGVTTLDVLGLWNTVKNLQLTSAGGHDFFVDGFVHVDAQIGYGTDEASNLFLNGVKRANIITGDGGDTINIRMAYDQKSVWVDDFRIATNDGDDFVRIAGLDIEAELAAGDITYLEAVNKPGLPLLNAGEGHNNYIALGAGNDTFVGYTSNDHVEAGSDSGSVHLTYQQNAPVGVGYSVGGATAGGHTNTLYKIDLATGTTTKVGALKVEHGKSKTVSYLDVETLSFNPKDGFLYGVADGFFGKHAALIRVDPQTAQTNVLLNLGCKKADIQDFAYAADGSLFVASAGDLLKIDGSAGIVEKIGDNTLSKSLDALAFDPTSETLYGLVKIGVKTYLQTIDTVSGKVITTCELDGLNWFSKIEGMAFDSAGNLWAEDRLTGKIFSINLDKYEAVFVSSTLSAFKQTGDGFESLAIDNRIIKELVDVKASGGDLITTGEGADHIFYGAGDGVDRITDFDVEQDTLHITGYTADSIDIRIFNGNTIIRFKDASDDGFVADALIQLDGVSNFSLTMISSVAPADFYGY